MHTRAIYDLYGRLIAFVDDREIPVAPDPVILPAQDARAPAGGPDPAGRQPSQERAA